MTPPKITMSSPDLTDFGRQAVIQRLHEGLGIPAVVLIQSCVGRWSLKN